MSADLSSEAKESTRQFNHIFKVLEKKEKEKETVQHPITSEIIIQE